jgi:chemotaxis protein methyltransferase CheR
MRTGHSFAFDEAPSRLALDDESFAFFREMAKRHAGINLSDIKRNMVFRRISKRLAALGLSGFKAYRELLANASSGAELQAFVNVMTTNKTEFFRESHHFSHFTSIALPEIAAAGENANSRELRVWSAGCSTGQEPYTIAMMIKESAVRMQGWDIRILATDIDSEVIDRAHAGIYSQEEANSIPVSIRSRYAHKISEHPDRVQIMDELRRMVTFNVLNLHGEWPMRRKYDAIFCRNVLIYFDKPAQRQLFDRFADLLREGGLLYVGHSESLYKMTERFRPVGQSVHRKVT